MKRCAAALFAAAFPLFANAADKIIPRASKTIGVSIVNLDLIITDKRGHRVHGLTKDDFKGYRSQMEHLREWICASICIEARDLRVSTRGGRRWTFNGPTTSMRRWRARVNRKSRCCWTSLRHRCEGDALGWKPRCIRIRA